MRVLAAAVLLWLLLGNSALAQVNVIGAVTPGHCASFFSTSQIQDSGSNCGGGGGGGITGPGVSTVGDLAVWNNATGTALADTGLSFPGGFSFAGTLTGATAVTFPTSGTLVTTAIFAAPPAIGSTTPAAGAFTTLSASGNLTTNVTGSTQCLQANTSGVVSGTGSACAAGGGAVSSVTGTAGQVTVSPTTGAVVVSLPASITASETFSGTVNHTGPFQIGGTTVALPITLTNGGTNNALTASAGGIVWSDASKLNILAGTSTAGQCLLSGNLATPSWATCPGGGGTPGGAANSIQYNNAGAFGGFGYTNATSITALGNGATAQQFIVYNTVDNISSPVNFERGLFDWTTTANALTIGTQSAGTGTSRRPEFISSTNSFAWKDSAGNFRMYLSTALLDLINGTMIGFEAAGGTAGVGDTGISRSAAAVLAFGNGTQSDRSAYIQWGGEARVTADFAVTSSVALVNVTGLTVNVAAGRTYQFTTELYVTDAAAGGVQAAIAGTATATAIQYTGYTIADNAIKGKTNATALATAVGSTVTTETAGIIVRITGTITVNAAGTLTVQMAQNTSNATATTAKRGSWLLVNDMP